MLSCAHTIKLLFVFPVNKYNYSDNPLKIEVPANSGKKIEFGGITIFVVKNGKIISEVGQEEAIDVAFQLGLIEAVK